MAEEQVEQELSDDVPTARSGLAGLVDDYLREQYDCLSWGDLRMRRGKNPVHKTRVAVRRLRSTLRIFAPLFDETRRVELDEELRWYAEALGSVRDLDVAREQLERELDPGTDDLISPEAAHALLGTLEEERARAWEELRRLLDAARYRELVHHLDAWRSRPPFTDEAAAEPDHVEAFVRRARKKSDKRLRQAAVAAAGSRPDADGALHRARKAAKRTRYAAELARPEMGKAAKKVAKKHERRQEALGELQDHRMMVQLLLELAARDGASPDVAFVCGVLDDRHALALAEARREWT